MDHTPENCPLKTKYEALEKRVEANERDIKDNQEAISDSRVSYAKLETLITGVLVPKIDETVEAVKNLLEKPGKRWDILIAALISGGGTLILSALFGG